LVTCFITARGQDRLARAGRADDDVGLDQERLELSPRPGHGVELGGQGRGALRRPVGHGQRRHPGGAQVARGQARHLAGPDHQHVLAVEIAEHPAG
jgi:hypothetical protein